VDFIAPCTGDAWIWIYEHKGRYRYGSDIGVSMQVIISSETERSVFRILIQIRIQNADPDAGGLKSNKMKEKTKLKDR
jgi:hypothetical protein